MMTLILSLLVIVTFAASPGKYYINGCEIYEAQTLKKRIFPGVVCAFADNGIIYSATETHLRAFGIQNEVLWEITGHFHHQLNFSQDKKVLLALSSSKVQNSKKAWSRADKLMVISLQGKVLREMEFAAIKTQTNIAELSVPLSGELADIHKVYSEISHFNSFYEIPDLAQSKARSYLKEASYVVNGLTHGIFFIDSDLKKVLRHHVYGHSQGHQVHDVQVLPDGNLLLYNNLRTSPDPKAKQSSIDVIDLPEWNVINTTFGKYPFYSAICGGVQILDDKTWLASDADQSFWQYDLSQGRIVKKVMYDLVIPPPRKLSVQQIKIQDLTSFLSYRN